MSRRRGTAGGFTLLEVMIAVIIMALMTAMIYGSFINIANSTELARANSADLQFRQYIWRSFTVNMASVYTELSGESAAYSFIGTDDEGPFGPADSLQFCTALEMPGAKSLPGMLKTVSYAIIEAEDQAGAADGFAIDATEPENAILEIYEAPLVLDADDDDISVDSETIENLAQIREVPIASMDITYYDDQAEEWVDEWDSTAEKRLPWAVRVRINLARSEDELDSDYAQGIDAEEDADIDMSFSIPIASGVTSPFTDFNHMRRDMFEEDADSIFNGERRGGGERRR